MDTTLSGLVDIKRSVPDWYGYLRADHQQRSLKHAGTVPTAIQTQAIYHAYVNWIASGGMVPEYYGEPEGKPYFIRGVASPAMDASGMIEQIAAASDYGRDYTETLLESLYFLYRKGIIPSYAWKPSDAVSLERVRQEIFDRPTILDDLSIAGGGLKRITIAAAVIVGGLVVLNLVRYLPAPRRT